MPFFLLLVYIGLSYIFPGEIFPALEPYRVTYWVGLAGLLFSALWLMFKRATPLSMAQLWFLVAFTLTLAVSRVLADRWLGAVVPTLTQFGPSVAMFVLTLCTVDSMRKLRIAAGLMVLLSLTLVLQGIAAYHFGYRTDMFLFDPVTRAEYTPTIGAPDEPADSSSATDDTAENGSYTPDDEDSDFDGSTAVRIRGLGLLQDPNDLALGLVIVLPLVGAGWRARATMRNLLLVTVPAALLIYGIFLTRSRGGALALALTLCVAASRKIGRVGATLAFVAVMMGGLATTFVSQRQLSITDDSATGRVEAWREGFEMFKSEPVFGIGYTDFLDHHTLTAHNSMVLCFAETGLVGYFFWTGLLVITFVQLHSLQKLSDEQPFNTDIKQWARRLQLSMIGFVTAAFFLSRTYVPMLYLLVGLSVALVVIARNVNGTIPWPTPSRLGTLILASEVGSILFIYTLIKVDLVLTR